MAKTLLLDTDVLIDYLRGQPEAIAFLQKNIQSLRVSCVTVAEVYVGVREGRERETLDQFISLLKVADITPAIAVQAGLWRRDYGKAHGTGLMDALIAATARHTGSTLVTLNSKHFPMLEAVLVPYRKN
jgi:hypothetical protein